MMDVNVYKNMFITAARYNDLVQCALIVDKFKKTDIAQLQIFLRTAIFLGKKQFVEILVDAGADVNLKGEYDRTPLMLATEVDRIDMIEYLISKGANINAQDIKGLTALMIAIHEGNNETAKVLIKHGADIYIQDLSKFDAAIHALAQDNAEILRILLGLGATALMYEEIKESRREWFVLTVDPEIINMLTERHKLLFSS